MQKFLLQPLLLLCTLSVLAQPTPELIKDINPSAFNAFQTSSFDDENLLAVLGDKLIFAADDGTHGIEPWVSDGTAAGTMLLKDIKAGDGDGIAVLDPRLMHTFNGKVYFTAQMGTRAIRSG